LLSSFNSLKYGLDVRIAVLSRVCPLFNAVSAFLIGIMSLGLRCGRSDPFWVLTGFYFIALLGGACSAWSLLHRLLFWGESSWEPQ
jgi:hypothetical protein